MKIIWWETFLVVFLPLLFITIFCCYRLNTISSKLVDHDWQNSLQHLQSGDLLFTRYTSKHGKLIQVFTGHQWSHVALVYRRGNNVSLIEVADYTGYDLPNVDHLSGLCVIPIQKWLQLNSGRLCGYRRYKGSIPITDTDIQRLLCKYKDITLDMDLQSWAATLFNKKNTFQSKKEYYCSEFIAALLQDLQIISNEIDPTSYSPAKLALISNYYDLYSFLS